MTIFTGQLLIPQVFGIGCFVCSSINHSQPTCEDTFNNSIDFFVNDCYTGRRGRWGIFPGTSCVKMKGKMFNSDYTVTIRNCVVDDGDINADNEIARSQHCGLLNRINYENVEMSGCLLSCSTYGCNNINNIFQNTIVLINTFILPLLLGLGCYDIT